MFDILIRNGRVMDGSGNPWYRGDIGVLGDRIEAIGNLESAEAAREIDAKNRVVSPGFIDMHAHSEIMLLAQPKHEGKVRQGVTTELLGNCGLSYAPASPQNLRVLRRYLAGTHGNPDISWDWRSVDDFLSRFDDAVAVNVAYLVPHCVVRLEAMGWEKRTPTDAELTLMEALVHQGMKDGAFGFSTGLSYPPNSYADTDELIRICRVVARNGGVYATHIRSYFAHMLEAVREAIYIGREAGVPVQISHLKVGYPEVVELIEQARLDGVDVTADSYPYSAGSGPLFRLLPDWIAEGGPDAMVARLRQSDVRSKIVEHFEKADFDWDACAISSVRSETKKGYEGRAIAELVRASGKAPVDFLCELLVEEDLAVSIVNYVDVDETGLRRIIAHPTTMVGSDGLLTGSKPHPRTYGTFPRYLRICVRELGLLRWEEAMRKITSLPAQRLGLQDRGLLKKNFFADLVVFDPDTVSDKATFEDSRRFAEGIEYVLVNGQLVVDGGTHTGRTPGRALRHSA